MFNEVEKLIIENGIICTKCGVKGADVNLCTTIAALNCYEDEDRHNHEHDSNDCRAYCKCINGHSFDVKMINSCWCGWKQH